ncbi:carboxypeptidase-like regulatory domain-containing protein [Mucilaginibacter sp. BJC16-A38]|uniref:carboxypeptidase-like regulatory domain-containing protein n=1 Tax=Mucilaginibacter phenanthrenivorans TaxID=1234842 RepID=UPI002157EFC4|nr:carboxypeptidase-like regulatory domain-containing protein [Mucilaginibacter phenanthrenivorans]MCR8557825.1 carboxypeptidase-like regulatory domain-containing protein [Mucilaginibacter phenanthrenivorans]
MKKVFWIILMQAITVIAFGQSISIKGQVRNADGQPVPRAFVKDSQHSIAAFADSSGAFLIKVDPTASLTVLAEGYADAQVKIDNKTALVITLGKGSSSSTSNSNIASVADNNPDGGLMFLTRENLTTQTLTSQSVKVGFNQEPTQGNPYLFAGWTKGFAVDNNGLLLYDINNLYNYDKITGQLVFTKDQKSLMQVVKSDVKQFFLYDGKLLPHIFESAPVLGNQVFVEVMVTTPRYRLYKQTTTKLVRADYHNNGVLESGHRYDEYVDNVKYYFLKVGDAKAKSISLKKKAIKEAFASDADKFIDAQGSRDVDDDYLRELNFSLQ